MSITRRTASWMLPALAVLLTAAAPAAADTNGLSWGHNFAGMLGDGSTEESPNAAFASIPAPVVDGAIPDGVSLVEVVPGGLFTVGLGSDGNAYSWGRNCFGELGIGTVDGTGTYASCGWPPPRHSSPLAVALPDGVEVVDVAAGYDHAAAVGSDGKLYSWGQNCSGQLGIGSVEAECEGMVGPPHPTPAAGAAGDIPDGVKIVAADATQSNTLALGSDGMVYVTGSIPSATPDGQPHLVGRGELPAGVTVTQLAAGRNQQIVLGSDGKVYGLRMRPLELFAVAAGAIPETVKIVRIDGGYGTLYAVGDDGNVYAWGEGGNAQLGDGTTTDYAPAPVKVTDTGALSGVDVVDVAATQRAAAALGSDGTVYAWGSGYNGQLGNGTSGSEAVSTVPVAVSLPEGSHVSMLGGGSAADSLFALALSRLTVTKEGTGSGTVRDAADRSRIACGTTCSADFGPGQQVTLTATPATESTFIGWSGACSGREACTVTMDQARSVTATFRTGNQLVVSRAGSGTGRVTEHLVADGEVGQIDCGPNCVGAYPTWGPQGTEGPVTRVRLLATPAAGSTFSHWEGACASYGASYGPDCELHMSQAAETTAVFRARRTLSVSKSGSGQGLVEDPASYTLYCGSTCSATYDEGTVVTLRAYGYAGATFDGWGGACSGTGTCTVTMSQARTVTASFTAAPQYVPPEQQQPPPPPGWFPPPQDSAGAPPGAFAPPSSTATEPTTTKPAAKKKKKRCYKRKGKKRVRVACKKSKKKAKKKRRPS